MGNPFGCIFINQRFSESFKIVLFVCLSPVYQIISRSILVFDRKSPLWRNKNEWTQQPFSHYLQNGKNCFTAGSGFIVFKVTKTLLHFIAFLDHWKQRTKWPCKCKLWWRSHGFPLGKCLFNTFLEYNLSREFTVNCLFEIVMVLHNDLQEFFVVNSDRCFLTI